MTDWTNATNACELPDGTQVEDDGDVYTAFPASEIAGARIRWHSESALVSDRTMDGMLDAGAKVIGRDDTALAEYNAIMSGLGR